MQGGASLNAAVQDVAAWHRSCNCTLQQCWLHSPAGNIGASNTHAYHGSRDDQDSPSANVSPNSDQQPKRSATEQLKALQDAIERVAEAVEEGQQAQEAAQLPERVARHAMRDPVGMLMTARGVPLGISLKLNMQAARRHQQERHRREAEADKQDWQELLGGEYNMSSSNSKRAQAADDYGTNLPSTDAQLMRQKLVKAARKLAKSAASASSSEASTEYIKLQDGGASSTASGSNSNGGSSNLAAHQQQDETAAQAQVEQVSEQLAELLASSDRDSWGTTQQSTAEIAQQIADSNRAVSGSGDNGNGAESDGSDDSNNADEDSLTLSPSEQKYADESAVAADLKELDEIYEMLAKVPWLDDGDVDERELRGVVAVSLLGTLEEVGWQLREKLLSLWAGERDIEQLTKDVGPKEAAALTAILYHTQQMELQYNKPPAAGVAATLAAAGGAGAQLVQGTEESSA
eukprot:GHRR01013250.1.p1 GENE.GHRR01013250.1~~GHRR01013250.1.p1  ORF type:complete len:462 (+),score=209.55 GHRR01013250.1:375-1760(+)